MKEYHWQHICFVDGGNPYICKTENDFKRMQRKYRLKYLGEDFWVAMELKKGGRNG